MYYCENRLGEKDYLQGGKRGSYNLMKLQEKIMSDDFDDTDTFKLHRSSDPLTSAIGAHIVNTAQLKKIVYEMVKEAGRHGITPKEAEVKYERMTGKRVRGGTISGRPKDLETEGLIFYLEDKRDRSRVMRTKEWEGKLELYGDEVIDKRSNKNVDVQLTII